MSPERAGGAVTGPDPSLLLVRGGSIWLVTLAMAWKFSSGAGGSRALEAKQSLLRCFSRKRCGCFPRKKPVQLLSRVSWELKEKIGRPGVSSSSVDVDKFGGHWIVAEPDELVEPAGS